MQLLKQRHDIADGALARLFFGAFLRTFVAARALFRRRLFRFRLRSFADGIVLAENIVRRNIAEKIHNILLPCVPPADGIPQHRRRCRPS